MSHGTELEADRGSDTVYGAGKAQFRDGKVGSRSIRESDKCSIVVDEFSAEAAALTAAADRAFDDDAETDCPGPYRTGQKEGLGRKAVFHAAISLNLTDQTGGGSYILSVFGGDGIHGKTVDGDLCGGQCSVQQKLFRDDVSVGYDEGRGKVDVAAVAAAAAGIIGGQSRCIGFRRSGQGQKDGAAVGFVVGIDLIHVDKIGLRGGKGQIVGIDVSSAAGTEAEICIHIKYLTGGYEIGFTRSIYAPLSSTGPKKIEKIYFVVILKLNTIYCGFDKKEVVEGGEKWWERGEKSQKFIQNR